MSSVSFIIPIYNRPEELRELLHSFTELRRSELQYQIIVVEDGSTNSAEFVIQEFQNVLPLNYIVQKNTGPGGARNRGAKHSEAEYLIFLDSDTLLPPGYMIALEHAIDKSNVDLFGGPDRAAENFTAIQKAINYSMTSVLTTGGIRGGKNSVDIFYPRTFNMGIKRSVFESLGGFREGMRYGEDLDISMRAIEAGYHSELFSEVWLYHKRRVSYSDFFNQVRHSGRARVILDEYHPGTLKFVHFLPSLFVIVNALAVFGVFMPLVLLYALVVFLDALIVMNSFQLALNAIAATYVQHFGYGVGFIEEYWNRKIRK